MNPGKYNFTIRQGASFSRVLTWKDAAGVAINLTGYTARMQIRAAVGSSTVILDLNTTNGRLTLGGVAGTITMALTAVETALLDWAVAPYDLEMVTGATVTPLLEGYATLRKEVTR